MLFTILDTRKGKKKLSQLRVGKAPPTVCYKKTDNKVHTKKKKGIPKLQSVKNSGAVAFSLGVFSALKELNKRQGML